MGSKRWWAVVALTLGCAHPSPLGSDDAGTADDAGLRDAGVPDGGSGGGGGGSCAHHSYRLCEDFESASAGGLPAGWTLKTSYRDSPTSPAVVEDTAHSGGKSLRCESSAVGQNRIAKSLSALGATAGTHWGRVFFKVEQPVPMPSSNGYLHGTFIAYQGASDEIRVMDWVRANPSGHVEINYQLAQGPFDRSTEYTALNDFGASWRCAEWYVDSVSHSFRYFLDGQEATALAFSGETGAELQVFPSVILGSIMFQALPSALTVWFDDFALDDARVGCGG